MRDNSTIEPYAARRPESAKELLPPLLVVDWNDVSPDPVHTMDKYLDDLICRS